MSLTKMFTGAAAFFVPMGDGAEPPKLTKAGPNLAAAVRKLGDEFTPVTNQQQFPTGEELAQVGMGAPTQGIPRRRGQNIEKFEPQASSPLNTNAGKTKTAKDSPNPATVQNKMGMDLIANKDYQKAAGGDFRVAGAVAAASYKVANDSTLETDEARQEAFKKELNDGLTARGLDASNYEDKAEELYKVGKSVLPPKAKTKAEPKTKTTTEKSAEPSPDSPVTTAMEDEIPLIDDTEQKLTSKFSAELDLIKFKNLSENEEKELKAKILNALKTAYKNFSKPDIKDPGQEEYNKMIIPALKKEGMKAPSKTTLDRFFKINTKVMEEINNEMEIEIPEIEDATTAKAASSEAPPAEPIPKNN